MTPLTHIHGEGHVAARYGLEEAIFLDAIMFWYRTNRGDDRNFYDERWWTYNSVKAYEELFPWWNAGQIRRIISRCREKGALLSGDYNQDRRDRTAWYTPSDELLELYGESEKCICRKQQMHFPEPSGSFDENDKCIIRKPCSNHEGTYMPPYSPPEGDGAVPDDLTQESAPEAQPTPVPKPRRTRRRKSVPDHCPERFEQFWAAYPGGGSRMKAVTAWDDLKPDDALIDEMARALKRQMASRQWRDGVGIPHASTWLNQRRWTDKLPERPIPRDAGGWAEDPEVMPDE